MILQKISKLPNRPINWLNKLMPTVQKKGKRGEEQKKNIFINL